MIAIQEMCARIGLITRNGLARIIKKKYSKKTVYPIISLLLVAIMRIGNDKKILEERTNEKISNIVGWITILVMGFSVVVMFLTWIK